MTTPVLRKTTVAALPEGAQGIGNVVLEVIEASLRTFGYSRLMILQDLSHPVTFCLNCMLLLRFFDRMLISDPRDGYPYRIYSKNRFQYARR